MRSPWICPPDAFNAFRRRRVDRVVRSADTTQSADFRADYATLLGARRATERSGLAALLSRSARSDEITVYGIGDACRRIGLVAAAGICIGRAFLTRCSSSRAICVPITQRLSARSTATALPRPGARTALLFLPFRPGAFLPFAYLSRSLSLARSFSSSLPFF